MYAQSVKFQIKRAKNSDTKEIEWSEVGTDSIRVPDEHWYFDNTLSRRGFDVLSLPTKVKESILQAVKEGRLEIAERIFEIYPDLLIIGSLTKPLNANFVGPKNIFIHNDEPTSIVIRDNKNSFVVVAKNRYECDRIVEEFRSSFIELSSITKRFGYQLESFLAGRELAKTWILANPLVKEVIERKPKNDFEKKVVNLLSRITGTFVSNTEIIFRGPSESFEYDIVLVLNENNVVVIEVKDYKGVLDDIKRKKGKSNLFSENMKSYLILRTVDKAVKLSPHVQILLLLRGFPNDILTKINDIAKPRGILILSDYSLEVKLNRILSYALAQLMHESKQDFEKNLEEFLSFKFR